MHRGESAAKQQNPATTIVQRSFRTTTRLIGTLAFAPLLGGVGSRHDPGRLVKTGLQTCGQSALCARLILKWATISASVAVFDTIDHSHVHASPRPSTRPL
jgi:hypothetical protein